jgi:RNA-directed DNA polymerase
MALVHTLQLTRRAQPTRRVWIPKPGTDERRPLGIPTMRDRAAQALLKLALEPEWEAVFEANSYGFRPGRSCQDAIDAIFLGVCHKPKFVLDADITKCFDRIDHAALLKKLQTLPTFGRTIRGWLRAGVMDGPDLFPTEAGTPQGGVISPLLANIALHGLEAAITSAIPRWSPRNGKDPWTPMIVRYADDFVVLHPDREVIERVQQVAAEWLAGMGLELSPRKTRIRHTLHDHDGQPPGFDFLGFRIRQYPVGKTHSGKQNHRKDRPVRLLGFKALIKPSQAAKRQHRKAINDIARRSLALPQAALIGRLNPVIRGWANYYSAVASHDAFVAEDRHVYVRLLRWAKRRHRNRPTDWIVKTYWRLETGRWTFATRDGTTLARHVHTPIRRHVKVKGARSPFDGDAIYWGTRLRKSPELPRRVITLLKRQGGNCTWCGRRFTMEDSWEVDHVVPRSHGGRDELFNLQLLHSHCHDQKSAGDSAPAPVSSDNGPDQ